MYNSSSLISRWIVITQEPPLPSIELLAKPEEKLAGIRFDPALLAPSRLDYATSIVLQHVTTGTKQVVELPNNSEGIRYIRFHPTKSYFVFVSKVRNESVLELYKCALDSGEETDACGGSNDGGGGIWTLQKLSLVLRSDEENKANNDDDDHHQHHHQQPRRMNFVYGCAYQFLGDGSDRLLVKVVPQNWPIVPPEEPVSTGPAIQVVNKDARKAPGRTYQGE
jgi:hypothetical protein